MKAAIPSKKYCFFIEVWKAANRELLNSGGTVHGLLGHHGGNQSRQGSLVRT